MEQELNSMREGKCWDDVKGGGLDPVLIRKAREEEDAVREEARGVRKGAHESVVEGDGEAPHRDRLGGHEKGDV